MAIFKRREILEQSDVFKLTKVWHGKKVYYEIMYYAWGGSRHSTSRTEEVKAFFPPQLSQANKWKFKNRLEAYKKYTWASLRWN